MFFFIFKKKPSGDPKSRTLRRVKYAVAGVPTKKLERITNLRAAQLERLESKFNTASEGARLFALMKGNEAELIAFETKLSHTTGPSKEMLKKLDLLEINVLDARIEYIKNFRSFTLKQKGSYASVEKILNETVGQMLQALSAKRLALRK